MGPISREVELSALEISLLYAMCVWVSIMWALYPIIVVTQIIAAIFVKVPDRVMHLNDKSFISPHWHKKLKNRLQ